MTESYILDRIGKKILIVRVRSNMNSSLFSSVRSKKKMVVRVRVRSKIFGPNLFEFVQIRTGLFAHLYSDNEQLFAQTTPATSSPGINRVREGDIVKPQRVARWLQQLGFESQPEYGSLDFGWDSTVNDTSARFSAKITNGFQACLLQTFVIGCYT